MVHITILSYIVRTVPVVPPSRLHARNGGINFSKFLYVREKPEYTYNIVRIQGYIVCVLKSRKTYSRYLKKFPRPKFFYYFANPVRVRIEFTGNFEKLYVDI